MTIQHWYRKLRQAPALEKHDILHRRWNCLTHSEDTLTGWLWFSVLLLLSKNYLAEEVQFVKKNLAPEGEHLASQRYGHPNVGLFPFHDVVQEEQLSDIFPCDLCEKTFSTARGSRVHISKIHHLEGAPMERDRHRDRGIDGMPICEQCGVKFCDWSSFDRHVRNKVCRTIRTMTHTSSECPRTPRTKAATQLCMIDDQTLKNQLGSDGAKVVDQDSTLRCKLAHHCCVCNQWFDKNHHLSHHGTVQHLELFKHGRSMLAQLRADWGIRAIMHQCRYCDAITNSKNPHKCVALLQIAFLIYPLPLSSPLPDDGSQRRRASYRKGDATVPTSSLESSRQRGLSRRKGCQSSSYWQRWDEATPPRDGSTGGGESSSGRNSRTDPSLQKLVVNLARLAIGPEDCINVARQDSGFVLYMSTKKPGMLDMLFQISNSWKEKRTKDPLSIQSPLRLILLKSIFEELEQRLSRLVTEEDGKAAMEQARKDELLSPDGKFLYKRWDPKQEALVAMDVPAPLSVMEVQNLVKELNSHLQIGVVHRFHSTRPLSPSMTSPVVPMLLEIGMRDDHASKAYAALSSLVQNSATQLGGFSIRQSSLQRSQLAKDVKTQLEKIGGSR